METVEKKSSLQNSQALKTHPRAKYMLVVIYLLSIAVPILWFSPVFLHNPIAGLLIPVDSSQGIFAWAFDPGYSVFEGDPMSASTQAAQAQFGVTMSIMSVFALIGAIPSSPLAKKFGIKTVVGLGGIFAVLGGAISAVSGSDFAILIVGRCALGLGVGLVVATAPTAISLWFSDKARALAVAIWSTFVPVGMLIGANVLTNPLLDAHMDFHAIWWIMTLITAVTTVLVFVFYRDPKKEEATEVSVEPVPFKKILPFIKQHQLIMLVIAWLAFNYINYSFTTYNVDFFQQGFGMDRSTANMWTSIASSVGILAPIFGAISDRINRNRKYLLIALGMLCLTLTCLFGFRSSIFGISGFPALFTVYLVFQILGNAILVATIRPYVPLILGKGGITAVTFGLSLVAFLEFGGQMFTAPIFGTVAAVAGYEFAANTALIPVGIVAFICCLFIKPTTQKDEVPQPLTGEDEPVRQPG